MKKRDPESTLSGRLALMTENRDYFRQLYNQALAEADKHLAQVRDLQTQLKAKEERFVGYKLKVERALLWYRQLTQEMLSKIPGGSH